jgi:hypothetical protein
MLALFGKIFIHLAQINLGVFMAKPKAAEAEKKKKVYYYDQKEKKAKEVKK